ncbi:two-component sensor histidine kinase [Nitratireductor sp. L1-7-SE]|uniref:histidine kinase n=1 Tax=Nitratireductor rhodophyticola TaxID=2854036 RepID=A0ABS7R848_9HYPH|nr:ATP-binding protein [Nitratireductor rhodophyticola]MBY8917102.1 two-component sensor histidine kinase [Nitratireductor rhodophyticola]MBY8920469.1 two-component sensor histidine kinase [Nitratireductor rhodophyticola]
MSDEERQTPRRRMLRYIAKSAAPLKQALQTLANRKNTTEPSERPRVVRGDIDSLPAVYLAAAVLDPLYIFDGAGSILYSNEAADLAFGPMTKSVSLRLKFRAPEMHELVSRVISGAEESTAINYSERVPVERAYRVVASRIGNDTGLYVLMFKDQSEARRIDRMRADFIANASHELRTPLASVAGFIETLRGPARDDAKARENFLQIMQNQTQRMARLIDDLLSLSRLEMKPYQKPNAQLDVVALVRGVIESMRHIASENGVEIVSELGDAPLLVAGHSDELVQVFENLLENACKYGSSGERILVSAEQASPMDEVRVRVQDFGPGIPEEHIPRITERFYRVDVETSRTQKGTGLGLSIVKHILTRHDARLSVKSASGKGATFVVHFPPVPPSGTGAESA